MKWTRNTYNQKETNNISVAHKEERELTFPENNGRITVNANR